MIGLPYCEKNYDDIMLSRFHLIPERNGRTDKLTDRRTDLLSSSFITPLAADNKIHTIHIKYIKIEIKSIDKIYCVSFALLIIDFIVILHVRLIRVLLKINQAIISITRCWHVTISCPPDARPPQPVRPWKSGRVQLAEGMRYSCFRITVFYGVRAGQQKVCEWGPKLWKI